MALEFMVIGLGISKSALASYGEMAGITVPFTFDILVLNREFLATDGLGLTFIVVLQCFNAYKSIKKAEEEAKKKKAELEMTEVLDSETDKF